MTYYVAPWSDISPGAVPTGPVQAVVCTEAEAAAAGNCMTTQETWTTVQNDSVATVASTVDVKAEVTGVSNMGFVSSILDFFFAGIFRTSSCTFNRYESTG